METHIQVDLHLLMCMQADLYMCVQHAYIDRQNVARDAYIIQKQVSRMGPYWRSRTTYTYIHTVSIRTLMVLTLIQ